MQSAFRRALSRVPRSRALADTPHPQPRKPTRWGRRGLILVATAVAGGAIYLIWEEYELTGRAMRVMGKGFQGEKKKVVVLGSGWAALSMIREIDTDKFDVTIVSPRNYFLFTPLLPSVTVGTLEARSIIEPLRKFCQRAGSEISYYEAWCSDIDPVSKTIQCKLAMPHETAGHTEFSLPYDYLVVGIGATNNTFGTPGVQERCHFLKEIGDAMRIRGKVITCFESANVPGLTNAERSRLLHFVVVGGGPAGVEFAAELMDFLSDNLRKWYPHLSSLAKISLVEMTDHILNTYDARISAYAEKMFQTEHIGVLTNSRVTSVDDKEVVIEHTADKTVEKIPYGMCVWATGIGTAPLVGALRAKIGEEAQANRRALVTDDRFRVLGSEDTIYAIGDCCTVNQTKLITKFVELFAERGHEGVLTLSEFDRLVATHLHKYPQFEHYGAQLKKVFAEHSTEKDLAGNPCLTVQRFKDLLLQIDSQVKQLPATAQVAAQEGSYLARHFNNLADGKITAPFHYKHFASLAYVGSERAVADFEQSVVLGGFGAWWLWRSVYLARQISFRNKVLVGFDWFKEKCFGRDITRV